MDFRSIAKRRIYGSRELDPRGQVGKFARGRTLYGMGGSRAAHRGGGPQFGRPQEKTASRDAIRRRLRR